ncbi:MAG: acyl-CoA carboxylase subunit beta [Candidatus Azotimanducaceae bacterium]|uniref:Propionyl-CoA carboxylase n=1 Tax=OM182 bacterium TaxID=2510334 RepID=A0A520RWS5_9GAMM|nr:propionyl-CoA carboxylase [Gammaproteobacteria bacterium]RZO74634.1 MAG: propionyl-CoA carboxylase [OM182 bacterium]
MSWHKESLEIELRRELSKQQGGPEAIEIHHAKGRLTVRERIDGLLGSSKFEEHGLGAGFAEKDDDGSIKDFTPANYVVGFGEINGRRTVVGGEDFTLKGGSPNGAGLRKSIYSEELAIQFKVPLVRMLEGGGGSVAGGGDRPKTVGSPVLSEPRFKVIAEAMNVVPVVSGAMGPVAGFPAGRLVASHFSVMVKETSQVMVAGPALVERALGLSLTKEQLGGWRIQTRSGIVDNAVDSEEDAFEEIRRFLTYMPQNVWQLSERIECDDDPNRADEELISIVPRDSRIPFDMRALIRHVVDVQSFFEIAPDYGHGQIIGLARLNGSVVGVIANDCAHFAGAMTAQGSQKAKRMMELCDTFHIPIVNFLDEPGFMIGPEAETSAAIKYGMSAVCAAVQSTVPWATVAVHKSFGVASAAHYAPNTYKLAWPSHEMGALPVQGGVAVAFHREIKEAENPEAKRRELEERLMANRSPFPLMESFAVHDLIDPRQTRSSLCRWIEWIEPSLEELKGPVSWGMRP